MPTPRHLARPDAGDPSTTRPTPVAHQRPVPRTSPAFDAFAVVIAALAALPLSFLGEWRMQGIIVDGDPSDPLVWSVPRLVAVAVILFCGLCPLSLWIAHGGVARAASDLVEDRCRRLKRLLLAIVLCVLAVLAGWALGLAAAIFQDNVGDWRYGVVFACVLVALCLFILFWPQIAADAAWGFLILSLAMGLALVAVMPLQANVTWDGAAHFNATNAMSYLENAEYDAGDMAEMGNPMFPGGYIREPQPSESRLWAKTDLESVSLVSQAITDAQYHWPVQVMDGTLRYLKSSWVFPSAVGRIPGAFGMWTARVLGLNDVWEYTGARIANLAIYVFLWFYGIRYLRSSKLVFSAIALGPVAMFLATNFGYDHFLIAMLGFSLCRYVGELQRPEEPIGFTGALAILVPYVIGCLVKAVYFPVGVIYLFMPKSKLQVGEASRRWAWTCAVVGAAALLVASFAVPFFVRDTSTYTDDRGGHSVDASSQLSYVLENPGEFAATLGRSGLEFFGPTYLRDAQARLNYLTPSSYEGLLGWTYFGFLVAVALLCRDELDRTFSGLPLKLLTILGVVGAYVLIATSLYISFTDVAKSTVSGLQPKYLLPFIPLLGGVLLNVPALGMALGKGWRRAAPVAVWAFAGLYYVAFLALRFVVFFE